jgi:hypothetical protein
MTTRIVKTANLYADMIDHALYRKNNQPWWLAFGRTSAWPNEANPPDVELATADIDEAFVFVKPIVLSMARVVSEADYLALPPGQGARIVVNDVASYFALVADEDAFTQFARWVYYRAELNPITGMPVASYRQVGVFVGLVPAAGYEQHAWLAPGNVQSRGRLIRLSNGTELETGPSGPLAAAHGAIEFA